MVEPTPASFPRLLDLKEIERRLRIIFPEGTPSREHILKPVTAKTVFAALFVGAIATTRAKDDDPDPSTDPHTRWLAPRHMYRLTDELARDEDEKVRSGFFKKTPSSSPTAWYRDNSREAARDEGVRQGLVPLNAMIQRYDIKTNSSAGRYALHPDFAALLTPTIHEDQLRKKIEAWQTKHLDAAAIMRGRLARRVHAHTVTVHFPQGGSAVLPFGESPEITKAVVEDFSKRFLKEPIAIWISDSSTKVIDDTLVKDLKIPVDAPTLLPDVILADIGGTNIKIILVEVVSTDGAITHQRQEQFTKTLLAAGLKKEDLLFVTAYNDRGSRPAGKIIRELAWGSFAWFRSEPEQIIHMASGKTTKLTTLVEASNG